MSVPVHCVLLLLPLKCGVYILCSLYSIGCICSTLPGFSHSKSGEYINFHPAYHSPIYQCIGLQCCGFTPFSSRSSPDLETSSPPPVLHLVFTSVYLIGNSSICLGSKVARKITRPIMRMALQSSSVVLHLLCSNAGLVL